MTNNSDRYVGSPCYLAGNFNGWSPNACLLGNIPARGEQLLHLLENVEEGELDLKITRGSWNTLTANTAGRLLPATEVNVAGDTDVYLTIEAWRDDFPASTASGQVSIMAESFYFPKLNAHRRLWIYLPKNYRLSEKRYPVIYMHDGQHLFDEATSVGRGGPVEWMVDETIDEASADAIVIAIEHAPEYEGRKHDYLLFATDDTPAPRGLNYLQDIITTLKPYVDEYYRTLPDAPFTAMVGSSLGGLLSLYAGLYYPQVFGTLGVFSPSIWTGREELYSTFKALKANSRDLYKQQRYYFYAGDKENRRTKLPSENDMLADVLAFTKKMKDQDIATIQVDIQEGGKHGATYWQCAFSRFFSWWTEA